MLASIDVGSNTVRMLLARVEQGRLIPCRHERAITRLGGGFIEGVGLAPQGMERTLAALQHFAGILQEERPTALRVVGTAAIRRAPNRDQFVQRVNEQSGLRLEVIDGQQEARLSALGVLEALYPRPAISLVIDIGGGSTELILLEGAAVRFRQSYQLGVVRLCEEYPRATDRQEAISKMLDRFESDLSCLTLLEKIYNQQCEFVGTAGTVTSLAALDLQMETYDWRLVNNYRLSLATLEKQHATLRPMSVSERESLPGLETGRGDLILPGIELLLALARRYSRPHIRVSDFGILEGVILDLFSSSFD